MTAYALPQPNDREFALVPPGSHLALCYRVIDLGTQDTSFKGQAKRARKVMIGWELPDELMEDGRPFTISQRYTWSMSEKAILRQHLEAWRGAQFTEANFRDPEDGGFNIRNILTVPCLLNILHSEDGKYANIKGVSKLPKSMPSPKHTVNPLSFLWLAPDAFDKTTFDALSDNMKTTIAKSPEYQAITSGRPIQHDSRADSREGDDTDAPF